MSSAQYPSSLEDITETIATRILWLDSRRKLINVEKRRREVVNRSRLVDGSNRYILPHQWFQQGQFQPMAMNRFLQDLTKGCLKQRHNVVVGKERSYLREETLGILQLWRTSAVRPVEVHQRPRFQVTLLMGENNWTR